jgi:hypothetical protein
MSTLDTILSIISTLTVSTQTLQALNNAYQLPTNENIELAKQAFLSEGKVMPLDVQNYLSDRHWEYMRSNPSEFMREYWLWLIGGGVLLMFLFKR